MKYAVAVAVCIGHNPFHTLTPKPPLVTMSFLHQCLRVLPIMGAAILLSACGGGGGSGEGNSAGTSSGIDTPALQSEQGLKYQTSVPADLDARRFLTQATFGPTEASVSELKSGTLGEWIDRQLTLPPSTPSHLDYMLTRSAEIRLTNPTGGAWNNDLTHSFWRQAIGGDDQLRQRVAFALSQIFVVSWADGCGGDNPRSLASYMDMLTANSFVKYRQLLEKVAKHPMMGCYLSHLKNRKEDLQTGRVPDENFAREIMQLFSIGLYSLNTDGTLVLDRFGQPIETYTADDVSGMAKVFTGWSFDCPNNALTDSCFWWAVDSTATNLTDPDVKTRPMVPYARFHSTSAKNFLGVTIAAQDTPDAEASMRVALDTLAKHPNVGPFIGKQLIQRLVTSNPSPAYVRRVAQRFVQTGGDLGETVKAILLDPEARDPRNDTDTTFGKPREPILKLTALIRAFDGTSDTGRYLIDPTDDAGTALAQSAYKSPSVFNFYRPGYVVPSSSSSAAGLVAPELQLMNESSAAGYVNYIRDVIDTGVGRWGISGNANRKDIQLSFHRSSTGELQSAAEDPEDLVDIVNTRLMYGTMPDYLKSDIEAAIASIDTVSPNPSAFQISDKRLRRLKSALLLTMASPEFQVQR